MNKKVIGNHLKNGLVLTFFFISEGGKLNIVFFGILSPSSLAALLSVSQACDKAANVELLLSETLISLLGSFF